MVINKRSLSSTVPAAYSTMVTILIVDRTDKGRRIRILNQHLLETGEAGHRWVPFNLHTPVRMPLGHRRQSTRPTLAVLVTVRTVRKGLQAQERQTTWSRRRARRV